ncbi:hypothetical protein IFR04_003415 [Cadophora malorum]|uniref:BTB domain-containing protein n=1 Tax=Cadophora malorum TaxID=108018 RepID=A0A8H7WEJ6_9HELO|nr:hypothetical protein IFR04_003415 [Cadophora malorum]
MATNLLSSLTPTNTPALTMSSTIPLSQDTAPSSLSTLVNEANNATPRMNEYGSQHLKALEDSNTNRVRYFKSPTIKIDIGPERAHWNIPRSLLLAKIPYLKPILEPSSTEKDTAGIVMHNEDPSTFAHVVDWMLTGEICTPQDHQENESELFLPLLALHAFALRFKMQEFAELVKDKIRTCLLGHHCLPTAAEIHQVFSTGNEDSTMKRLIVKGIVDVFLGVTPQEVLGGLEGWSRVVASHPEFTAKFLMAVKVRAEVLGGDVDVDGAGVKVGRKRKRQEEAEEEAEREYLEAKRARVVDLTE